MALLPRHSRWLASRLLIAALAPSVVFLFGCGSGDKSSDDPGAAVAPSSSASAQGAAADAPNAQAILRDMVKAYREAPGYEDEGRVILGLEIDGKPGEDKADYRVALARPGKLRVQAYQGAVVCDGQTLFGFSASAPQRVLRRPAPQPLTIPSIFSEAILADSMAQGPTADYFWVPAQVVLLLADDPLKTLLHRAARVELLDPGTVEGRTCHRVQVSRPEGKSVFWIDQQSHVLRRIVYPTELLTDIDGTGRAKIVSLVVELANAQLAAPTDPKAFVFEVPKDAEVSDVLVPHELAGLGKPSPDFFFDGLDGKPITRTSLAGKVVVIDFWATWCQPCRQWLPELQKVYERFQNNPQVAFLAVSVDAADVPNGELAKALDGMGVRMSVYRDSREFAAKAFHVLGIPTTIVLDAKGNVQSFDTGGRPTLGGELANWIDRLLAGKDVFPDKQRALEIRKADYQRIFEHMVNTGLYISPLDVIQELPPSGVAEKTAPKRLQIAPAWKCAELTLAGDVLCVESKDGPPRIYVIDGGRAVAELDPASGKVLRREQVRPADAEPILFLRTNVGADGKRLFVGSGRGAQQFHVFDENLRPLWSLPPDAERNRHAGVGDVQVGDLDADGRLEACVGYLGLVGVKCFRLDAAAPADAVWSQRAVANVCKLALEGPDATGKRRVLCANEQTSLVAIDSAGQLASKISLDGRLLYWIATADVDGRGGHEMCGLCAPELGRNVALGMDAAGNLLWSHDLPDGLQQSSNLVGALRLDPEGPAHWLLVGPDGSLHVVSASGQPVDQFNYGSPIHGMATTRSAQGPVLIITSPTGVEALRIQGPR
ncbi:MAG: redoxin domain-containing protein [Pirellulales bacterium]|nr:redoxin domain-containing protein [Pirellulales bacterium]